MKKSLKLLLAALITFSAISAYATEAEHECCKKAHADHKKCEKCEKH